MPAYFIHGFRWPRSRIRAHVFTNMLEEPHSEYIMSPQASRDILHSFRALHPGIMGALPPLSLLEQYSPSDNDTMTDRLTTGYMAADYTTSLTSEDQGQVQNQNQNKAHAYAFVADKVHVCELSLDATEAMRAGVGTESWNAMMDLKERLAPEAKLGWYVVYNGDDIEELQGPAGYVKVRKRNFPNFK